MLTRTIGISFFSVAIIALLMAPASAALIVTYDFSTDDFGTPLVNGQHISTLAAAPQAGDPVLEFGKYSVVTTTQGSGGHIGASVFDTDPNGPNAGGEDPDLLVDTGNILILQDNQRPATTTGANGIVFDVADDEAALDSGSIIFDFAAAGVSATPLSIDIVDANGGFGGAVIMTDDQGDTRTYTIPSNFSNDLLASLNGFETLDLTETVFTQTGEGGGVVGLPVDVGSFDANLVSKLEVRFTGRITTSGGIDNFRFMIPEPTTALLTVLGAIAALPVLRCRSAKNA